MSQYLFKKNKSSLFFRFIFFLFLAILLMIGDARNRLVHRIRVYLSYGVLPIEYVVHAPLNFFHGALNAMTTQTQLLKENATLHTQLLLLQSELQKQSAIESENKELKTLLFSGAEAHAKMIVAEVLAIAPDASMNQVVIDKGANENVFVGQPVVDATGIVGQVMETNALTSRVLLLTDPQSAIAVQDKRNGVRAIAVGAGGFNTLELKDTTGTTDIIAGDELISSGLDQRYPYGYPVGTVISVQTSPDAEFAKIMVKPAAQLDRVRLVLLLFGK